MCTAAEYPLGVTPGSRSELAASAAAAADEADAIPFPLNSALMMLGFELSTDLRGEPIVPAATGGIGDFGCAKADGETIALTTAVGSGCVLCSMFVAGTNGCCKLLVATFRPDGRRLCLAGGGTTGIGADVTIGLRFGWLSDRSSDSSSSLTESLRISVDALLMPASLAFDVASNVALEVTMTLLLLGRNLSGPDAGLFGIPMGDEVCKGLLDELEDGLAAPLLPLLMLDARTRPNPFSFDASTIEPVGESSGSGECGGDSLMLLVGFNNFARAIRLLFG